MRYIIIIVCMLMMVVIVYAEEKHGPGWKSSHCGNIVDPDQAVICNMMGLETLMIDEFDWNAFATEVTRNEDILRTITGEEAFRGIKRMSDFMQIATRSSADRLSDLGVSIVVPRGLSVESYVSRVYAISRGIISPKYVATEVALLQIRKKNANLLAKILQDPKAVDAVIDLIERGGDVSHKTHAKILTTILTTLANLPEDKEENNLDSQMNMLRR